ncbi:taste receptor type 1 member 1 [Thalassophryne amazonica]|uniref:taste receptor type 1 member 1 n=1 Tax=Thalassophryne amazonica TaxID=390379 RepID=UPI001470C5A3|nr:taste receptor type 1 member 1 [Thalassophryne amazonica]
MKRFLASVCLLELLVHVCVRCSAAASEFKLEGDYLLGGLFDVHRSSSLLPHDRPVAIDCSSQPLSLSSYRRFQVMRFSVEQINNSTDLLPNVSLGYEIFDHCSDLHNFPGILKLISSNGSIKPLDHKQKRVSRLLGVLGPFESTETVTVAPFFTMNLIPLIGYGAAASILSEKQRFPTFLRTVHSNKHAIRVLIKILLHFNWTWVAFLNSDSDYGKDSLELFRSEIKNTKICLAYNVDLNHNTNYSLIFKQIEAQQIHAVIVFAAKRYAEAVIEAAIRLNITKKVWIASDAWSLNKKLRQQKGIQSIGTVLGISESAVYIPGFTDFIYSSKSQNYCDDGGQEDFCNQACNCSSLSPEDIVTEDQSYSFPVYSAVYAVAHALHNILQCGAGECSNSTTVHSYMVLDELKKSNFTLLNQKIQFDANGDPTYGTYSVVFWNHSGDAQVVGFEQSQQFFINNSKIEWHTKGVPVSLCSKECPEGYAKKQDGIHKCCFNCQICPNGSYINTTENPYQCLPCKETEWSTMGSMSCSPRSMEYVPFTDSLAIATMVVSWILVVLTLAMSVLFAKNYNTPVVKSAGGPMCFLILGCLSLCSLSIFFYFGKPTTSSCILRFLPFLLFYTPCLACFVVRSFQIVCIFKIAAKFPQLRSWWMKYHGQWLVITVAFTVQTLLLIISYSLEPPKPNNETFWYPDKIILGCELKLSLVSLSPAWFLVFLCLLCFIFSYMGKDLPKNYNEAKAITFCLLLLIITWIIFSTEYLLYYGKYIETLNAISVLSSLYSFLFWYFLPKCYIIIFQPHKNTQQYFQGIIQTYTKTMSQ